MERRYVDAVVIDGDCTFTYNVKDALKRTMTVRELVEYLENNFGSEDKVIIRKDGGYSYRYFAENMIDFCLYTFTEEDEE